MYHDLRGRCEFPVAVHHIISAAVTISDWGTLMKSANELSLSATDSGRRKLMGLRFSLGLRLMIDREFPFGQFCNAPASEVKHKIAVRAPG
jgi:hypothetical protein